MRILSQITHYTLSSAKLRFYFESAKEKGRNMELLFGILNIITNIRKKYPPIAENKYSAPAIGGLFFYSDYFLATIAFLAATTAFLYLAVALFTAFALFAFLAAATAS